MKTWKKEFRRLPKDSAEEPIFAHGAQDCILVFFDDSRGARVIAPTDAAGYQACRKSGYLPRQSHLPKNALKILPAEGLNHRGSHSPFDGLTSSEKPLNFDPGM
jgi:hypothetical protein